MTMAKSGQEVTYEQGKYIDGGKTREYFYYLDHQGQLFLDDAKIKNFTSCFKEQQFLQFFFRQLRWRTADHDDNAEKARAKSEESAAAAAFPFVSLCGRERNYLRCDDLPLVLTELDEHTDTFELNHVRAAHWKHHFEPANVYHHVVNGRLYYLLTTSPFNATGRKSQQTQQSDAALRPPELIAPWRQICLVRSEISIRLIGSNLQQQATSGDDSDCDSSGKFTYKSAVYTLNDPTKQALAERMLKAVHQRGTSEPSMPPAL